MAVPYYNPNKFPYQSNKLGTILGVKDGQLRYIKQVNGVGAGEPLFIPPKSLIDKAGIYAAITNLPTLDKTSVMSFLAKDSSDTLLFTTAIAQHLVSHMFGVSYIPLNKTPPRTKSGWYDPANPLATKFGALDLTYRPNRPVSIARDNVVAVQMGASLKCMPGDLIMAAYAATADFGKFAPLLTRVVENKTEVGNDITLGSPWCVELDSVHILATKANEWDAGSRLTPDIAANVQLIDLVTADGDCEIVYKYWELGNLIPIGQIYKCVLGRCLISTYTDAEIIGLEVWS